MNKIGPRTQSWGTPYVIYFPLVRISFRETTCFLLLKQLLNQSRLSCFIPIPGKMSISLLWSTVSNAFASSIKKPLKLFYVYQVHYK